jgi:hypothetical protein
MENTTGAETLRRAAALMRMRADAGLDGRWVVDVADWLDLVARRWPTGRLTRERASALAVVRAYLGETTRSSVEEV